ncbi:NAD(P)H-binding protein [Candidatus Saccharibacteria bacterium]|nr:NAD(P)H-binding protein [Candidatus Saccharibacteria bacterium]
MKVIVFGATGGTGIELVKQLIDRNYEVSAFIHKNTGALEKYSDKINFFRGDVLDYNSVQAAISGQEAVLVALGVVPGVANGILSDGTGNIIKAMRESGAKRLVVETGAGLVEDKKTLPVLWRLSSSLLPPMRAMFEAKRQQESAVMMSDLDWVIVRPANLTNDSLTKEYNVGQAIKLKTSSHISRANVADCMINQLNADDWLKKAIVVSED